jgi:hypothetical protein
MMPFTCSSQLSGLLSVISCRQNSGSNRVRPTYTYLRMIPALLAIVVFFTPSSRLSSSAVAWGVWAQLGVLLVQMVEAHLVGHRDDAFRLRTDCCRDPRSIHYP